MSIYSNVTEEDMINLRKLVEQQKNDRALKIKNRILKQTHDIKLAHPLSPITKKLEDERKSNKESLTPISQKLDTIKESTQKVGKIIEESNPEIIPSVLLQDTIESLSASDSLLRLDKDKNGDMSILKACIKSLGGDEVKVNDNIYVFSPEIHKALSKPTFTGKSMKNENDQITLYNFLSDVGYNPINDENTSRTKFFKRLFNHFGNFKKEEPDNSEGKGIQKIIIPSNIVDIYTRLEILLGLKLSGHTDTLTEASSLIDEIYKQGEIQNKQQYQNALDKFKI